MTASSAAGTPRSYLHVSRFARVGETVIPRIAPWRNRRAWQLTRLCLHRQRRGANARYLPDLRHAACDALLPALRGPRLPTPPPPTARSRNAKQHMVANSPAFRSGKKPVGACAMKYATAISPARMNATGRVNKPSTISTPPTSSIMPLVPESDMGATPVEGETGKLKYFDVPC